MKYVFGLFIFALTLLLASCGPGRDLTRYLAQSQKAFNNLTGGVDALGNAYTGFSPPLEQKKMKEYIPDTADNLAFAKNIESAEALIDKQDLKVIIKWRNLEKPLEFQGRLLPKGDEFAGELRDTTNQRTDLKITATCNDGACQVISAFIEDQDKHRAGLIIRQEERELDLKLSDEQLKSLSKQKQEAFTAFRANNKVMVTSTEVFPGKTTYKINAPNSGGMIQGDLTETNNGSVSARTEGRISELGKVELVGNTNSGELVFSISNEIDAKPKAEPNWLKKLFTKKEEAPQKETVSAFVFIKPRVEKPVPESPSPEAPAAPKTEDKLSSPPVQLPPQINPAPKTEGAPTPANNNQAPVLPQVPVKSPELRRSEVPVVNSGSAHELVKQMLTNESDRKEIQKFTQQVLQFHLREWTKNNAEQITVGDLKSNGKLHRFLFLHEKLDARPLKIEGVDKIQKMVKILRENKLPAAVSMLSYVESGFYPNLTSSAAAHGWWQFMPATAAAYGLMSKPGSFSKYDQREDLVASTKAAAKYLNYLLEFWSGDIKMALASYNAGEGRMSNPSNVEKGEGKKLASKLRNAGVPLSDIPEYSKDFWVLSYYNSIPDETKKHVPKILTGVMISLDPKTYKIDSLPLEAN